MGQLDGNVGIEAIAADALQAGQIGVTRFESRRGVADELAEKIKRRLSPIGIQLGGDRSGLIEGLTGHEAMRQPFTRGCLR